MRIGVSIGTTRSLTADRASHLNSSSQLGQHAKLRWRRRSPSAETFSHDQDPDRLALVARDPSCVAARYFFLPRSSFVPVDFWGLSPNDVWAVAATLGFSFFGFLASRFPRC